MMNSVRVAYLLPSVSLTSSIGSKGFSEKFGVSMRRKNRIYTSRLLCAAVMSRLQHS